LAPHFPGLDILELIGVGGMGAVYKARQLKLDRVVALKILPAEWGRDPAFAERFGREARALARLNHPHIVNVHDFGEAAGHFFLLMEYVDGVNLRQLLLTGPLQPQLALQVIPQICDALQYAHEEGVVHRDVKPENVLLDRRGRVKIADFGLAKLVGPAHVSFTLTGTHQVMGTLDYMAPEQRLRPQEVDHRADIYSLGVLFYEMLTGELPLGRFESPSRRAGVDGRLDEIVFRALERDPDRRYQHASDVRADVESVAGGAPAATAAARSPAAATVPEEVRLRVSGPAIGLLLTAAVALVHGAGFGLLMVSEYLSHLPRYYFEDVFMTFTVSLAAGLVLLLLVGTIVHGALRLRRCEQYAAVIVAALLAMLPWSVHVLIGFPVGVWCLIILSAPEVRSAFAANLRRRRARPAGHPLQAAASFLRSLRSQFFSGPARPEPAAGAPRRGPANGWPDADARRRVNGPAVGLMVTAGMAVAHWGVVVLAMLVAYLTEPPPDRALSHAAFVCSLLLVGGLLVLALAGLIFLGGLRLRRCEGEAAVVIALLLAALPWSIHCLVGIPVAVWCLWAMTRPEVHAAFAANRRRREAAAPPADLPPVEPAPAPRPPAPTGPFHRRVRSFLHSLRSMFVSSPNLGEPTAAFPPAPAEPGGQPRQEV
jgi:hypothetical protein